MIELHPGERIFIAVRKHWIVFVFESMGLFLAAVAPLIFLILIPIALPERYLPFVPNQLTPLLVFAGACWVWLITTILAVMATNYYLDVLVVTNERLIDIDQLGLFARDIAEVPVANIEDVKVEIFGVFGHLFNFGNLYVQAASTKNEIIIHGLRNPERAKSLILEAHASTHQQRNDS